MAVEWKYRGRVITAEDIAFLRQFLAEHSGLSRRKLSAKVCEAWEWKQANGASVSYTHLGRDRHISHATSIRGIDRIVGGTSM